jgi:CheY-like chemotaxis protein
METRPMTDCIAVVSDLIFATRIRATAEQAGATCQIADSQDTLRDALGASESMVILVDMDCSGIAAEEAIRVAKARRPHTRVIAFFSHVEVEKKRQALAAGADDVWPRSTFVQRLPSVLLPSR